MQRITRRFAVVAAVVLLVLGSAVGASAATVLHFGYHKVRVCLPTGIKHFNHPAVGRLDLMFEAMAIEADDGLTLTAYTAEQGTPSHDGLKLLASWAATRQEQDIESS